jgi:hypothetical protein
MPRQVLEVCTAAELDLLTKYPGRTLEHCAKSLPAHEGFIDRWGSYVASGRNRVHEEDTAGVEKNGELEGRPVEGDWPELQETEPPPSKRSKEGEATRKQDKRQVAVNEPE